MRRDRTRVVGVLMMAVMASGGLTGSASGAATEVRLKGTSFEPRNVKVKVGNSVRWTRASGSLPHNVHQTRGIFHSGPPTSGPIDFTRTFSAGKFPYVCQVHAGQGMRGKVRVPVKVIPDRYLGRPLVRWASKTTNTGGRFDVQYQAGAGKWKNWKQNVRGKKSVFGRAGSPIALEEGVTYRFRARSQKAGRQSGWSPPKSYVHD